MANHPASGATDIRLAQPSDRSHLVPLRRALWPQGSAGEHERELEAIFAGEWSATYPYVILVAEASDDTLVGFAEVTLRSRADGCDPSRPVGYLEGWFVAEEYRRRGIGGALLHAAEEWARAHGRPRNGVGHLDRQRRVPARPRGARL